MSVWTCGEAMGALRCDGPLKLGTTWTTHVAGAELNAAVGLSRLGHEVTWCSRVGDDDFGHLVVREARAEGVTLQVQVVPDAFTGSMQVIRQAGTSSVTYKRLGSAASTLDAEHLVAEMHRANPSVIMLSGITLALSASCRDGWLAVAEAAHDIDTLLVVDINHRPTLWNDDQAREALAPVIDLADVVVGDTGELALVCSSSDESAIIEDMFGRGVQMVAIKRGADGATLHHGGEVIRLPAESAVEVDPIGAGDAFTAGLISGLLDELDDHAMLQRAVSMGAWAVSTPGDWEGLPTRGQLLAGRGGVRR